MVRFARVGVATFAMCYPQVIRSHQLTRQNGGNNLKSQGNRSGLRVSPLNWMECVVFLLASREKNACSVKWRFLQSNRGLYKAIDSRQGRPTWSVIEGALSSSIDQGG